MIKRTLYFSTPAYLSLRNGQLVWKMPEVENCDNLSNAFKAEAVRTIPVEDIGVVILDNKRLTITHGLLEALLENNCAVITCDQRSMPVGLFLPLEGNNTQRERFTQQIEASLPLRKQLWQQTVRQKIANQEAVLRNNTDAETRCMKKWVEDVRSGDAENLEARAAAYYWKNLFASEVTDFVRGREEAPPNNLLNYGYAILRAVIARALVSSGLLPTLGIHHHNRYNAYCLADDIMEPYRPYVDELVLDIVRTEDYSLLTRDLKARLLSIPTLDVTIGGQRSPLMVAATTTTASLAKCFSGELRKVSYPEMD
ncbi:MAG: type II CRISPR-associated endonuclease Cas1 [Alloprevotella sp.]|nr:type II CRISPR-associated endonuclease Cas1 [Alloprevotella sp.]